MGCCKTQSAVLFCRAAQLRVVAGFGFSGKPAATGWDPDRIARAWAVLMQRLGYTRYVAQGGDWGTAISAAMGRQAPAGLAGIHVNFAQIVPPGILGHIRNGDPAPADLSAAERRAYEQVAFATYHRGYGVIQGTRPQTIGYSLADTPVGLAAWLLDHDTGTYEHLPGLFAGQPYGAITRDDWLDNTSLYWLTNTATCAARLYWQLAVTGHNFYAPRRRVPPGGSHGVPRGVRPRAAQLDRAGPPQPDLLQRSRQRRPLRRLGTTPTVLRRAARGIPHTALKETPGQNADTRAVTAKQQAICEAAQRVSDQAKSVYRSGCRLSMTASACLATSFHALADAGIRPVALLLSAGQAGDNPRLVPLLDALAQAGHRPAHLLADKAYSHPSTRRELRHRRIRHTIPERSDQVERRKDKGSAGGRPPKFDAERYKERNTIERGFGRFKQWRGIATRYDKYARTYLGGVLLAATVILARP